MWLTRFKRQAQWLTRPEQVLLANDLIRTLWPKLLSKRGLWRLIGRAGK
ncbi:MAG: hypothetical protein Q8R95_06035 [Azonexus sp.]|nr:hypothetical protein [Azonexus sp.]